MSFNKVISKFWKNLPWLFYLPWSIFFNFKHLPFKQACHLPIWLYKPRFGKLSGKIIISGNVYFGMIKLGSKECFVYPGRGISVENRGVIEFCGRCLIGNDSYISVASTGYLKIGDNFISYAACTLICHYKITLDDNVMVGWQSKIMDTDFHRLSVEQGERPTGYGEVRIGSGCWLGFGSVVLAGVSIPPFCVVSARSVVRKNLHCLPKTLLAGFPAKPVKQGVWLNRNDMNISFEERNA